MSSIDVEESKTGKVSFSREGRVSASTNDAVLQTYSPPLGSQFRSTGRAGRIREVTVNPSGISQLELVRACVDLGRLLPPDVAVEVCSCGDDGAASPEPGSWRMWTERSLANGAFIFEAHVPVCELRQGDRLRITVRHAAGGGTGQILDSRLVTASPAIGE